METIKYKDFIGSVEVSIEDNCVHGKILFINDLVTYESDTPINLKAKFKAAVDDYLETCKALKIEPHKSFSGSFNIRIEPERHQELAIHAAQKNTTINQVVKKAIGKYLDQSSEESKVQKPQIFNYFIEKPYNDLIPEGFLNENATEDTVNFMEIKYGRAN